jgi:hypothetical protein
MIIKYTKWQQYLPNATIFTKWQQYLPNGRKIGQMPVK